MLHIMKEILRTLCIVQTLNKIPIRLKEKITLFNKIYQIFNKNNSRNARIVCSIRNAVAMICENLNYKTTVCT